MWQDFRRDRRQFQSMWHREPAQVLLRFPLGLAQAPGLILFQDLIDPRPVMGDPGEDSRGLRIPLSIGDNALGHPSTQKRAP